MNGEGEIAIDRRGRLRGFFAREENINSTLSLESEASVRLFSSACVGKWLFFPLLVRFNGGKSIFLFRRWRGGRPRREGERERGAPRSG